jgi:hypothetical protein
MPVPAPQLLSTLERDATELIASHPPIWRDKHKKLVASLSCPPGASHRGRVRVTRWRARELPEQIAASPVVLEARPDVFTYEPAPASELHWHLNFADRRLFVAYGSGLLAQDELQVLEHPALGSVAEAMSALPDQTPLTAEDDPTPILIKGVERRCKLDTAPNFEAGRTYGLYGNRFQRATPEQVRDAVTVLDPPTISNILAIEAPTGYRGHYTAEQIRFVLRTAIAGYAAALAESRGEVVIHTGFWGCGAYGGNRELMAALQIIAARAVGISRLVFHAFDADGLDKYRAGEAVANAVAEVSSLDALVSVIEELGFEWGESDGN